MPVKFTHVKKGSNRVGIKVEDTFSAASKGKTLKIESKSLGFKWTYSGTIRDTNAETVARHVADTQDIMKASWSNFKTKCERAIAAELTTLEGKIAKSKGGGQAIDAKKTAENLALNLITANFEAFVAQCSDKAISNLGTKGAKAKALSWTVVKGTGEVTATGVGLGTAGMGAAAATAVVVGTAGWAAAVIAVVGLIAGIIGAIVLLVKTFRKAVSEYKMRQEKYVSSAQDLIKALDDTVSQAVLMRQKWDKLILTSDKIEKETAKLESEYKKLDSNAKKEKTLKAVKDLSDDMEKQNAKIRALKEFDPEAVEKYLKKLKAEIGDNLQLEAAAKSRNAAEALAVAAGKASSVADGVAKFAGAG